MNAVHIKAIVLKLVCAMQTLLDNLDGLLSAVKLRPSAEDPCCWLQACQQGKRHLPTAAMRMGAVVLQDSNIRYCLQDAHTLVNHAL